MTTPDAGQRLIEDLREAASDNLFRLAVTPFVLELVEKAADEIERLRGVEADARRYRWLRDIGDHTFRPLSRRSAIGAIAIDSAIDAAIAASRSTGAADVGEEHG